MKKERANLSAICNKIVAKHDSYAGNETRCQGQFNVARDAERRGEQRGKQKGKEDRDHLYSELIRRLVPLGRIDDVLAAASYKSKLSDLAKVFGLKT